MEPGRQKPREAVICGRLRRKGETILSVQGSRESQQGKVRLVRLIIRAGLWDSEGEGVCGSESEEAETKTGGILWHPNGQVA